MKSIIINTFRELIRSRVLYVVLIFAILFFGLSFLLETLAVGEEERIIVNAGLAFLEIVWLVLVIFLGSQLLVKEIEGKTIYLVLSKPITRQQFILGKFFGFLSVLVTVFIIQFLITWWVFWIHGISLTGIMILAGIASFFKLSILFAIVLLLTTSISPILWVFVSILVYIIGHLLGSVLTFVTQTPDTNSWIVMLTEFLYVVFPNFDALNLKSLVYIDTQLPLFSTHVMYTIIYTGIILTLTIFIFNRRTFEA